MSFIDTVKQWFQTGDTPTEGQFYWMFERLRWKDEQIAAGDINGLPTTQSGGAPLDIYVTETNPFVFKLSPNYLLKIITMIPKVDCNVRIGASDDESESIMPEQYLEATKGLVAEVNEFANGVSKDIVITGLPIGTKVVVEKMKLF